MEATSGTATPLNPPRCGIGGRRRIPGAAVRRNVGRGHCITWCLEEIGGRTPWSAADGLCVFCRMPIPLLRRRDQEVGRGRGRPPSPVTRRVCRSEEHTSEL